MTVAASKRLAGWVAPGMLVGMTATSVALSPASAAAAQQQLTALLTDARLARRSAEDAVAAIPCDGELDWFGAASDAWRGEGRAIRARIEPAVFDLDAAVRLIAAELAP